MARALMSSGFLSLTIAACGGLLGSNDGDGGSTSHDAATSDSLGTGDVVMADVADATSSGWTLAFESTTLPTQFTFINDIEIADVTGDGRADVIVAGSSFDVDASANVGGVLVYAQQQDGTLAAPVFTNPGLVYLSGMTPGDVTNDGRTDLVFATPNGLGVVAQDATGHLLPVVTYEMNDSGAAEDRLALGHFGPSAKLDVIQGALSNTGQSMWLWLQTTTGFDATGPFAVTELDRVASGDLDGDGKDDVVVSYVATSHVSVVSQTAPAAFGAPQDYVFTNDKISYAEGLAAGDVTGDGLADVVVTFGGNNPDCHLAVLAQHDGKLDSVTTYDTLDLPSTVRLADMNGDGRRDVVVDHAGFEKVGVYLQNANGTLEPEQLFPFHDEGAGRGNAIAVGDIDGDGRPDIAGIGWPDNSLLLLLSK